MADTPNICVVIPVYNHGLTVQSVVSKAKAHFPVIVVNDGSTDQTAEVLAQESGITRVDLPVNQGKAGALKAGFARALDMGFTHAITMDADGQHSTDALEEFARACRQEPDSIIVGVRNLKAEGAPWIRRATNDLSTFWFRFQTGQNLVDTQCGYRVYPLARINPLSVRSGRYAYELEIMVMASWIGIPLRALPVRADYSAKTSRMSHFEPGRDFWEISCVHSRLSFLAFCLPAPLRMIVGMGSMRSMPWRQRFRVVTGHLLADHTETAGRLSAAVGVGLFCGIAPIWGVQMLAAAALAHRFRLNKVIALLSSNISFPLAAPFILAAGLLLGHFLWSGEWLQWSTLTDKHQLTTNFYQWFFGSWVLAITVAAAGTVLTYCLARLFLKTSRPATERT
jgi:uncharacterized protein (DUF2062 family)